jgi:citronellyl-CoA dehydrogenase
VQFTPEHAEIRRTLRAIIDKDINPHVDKWEEDEIFPAHEVFKKLGDAGLLGIHKPVEFGGMGLDYSYAMVMAEELGHINCGSVPMAIGVQTDMATPALARYGSDELRREFLAPSITGDYVACLGVSEVGAGSDVASLKTTAKRVGGDWVINGGKMWTTNGTQADWMCLLANSGEGAVHKNKSLICLPMKTRGVQVVKKLDKLGMRSSDTAQIFFDEVKVPVKNLLWGAISAVVGMERLIDQTVEYTRERKVFGRPLLDNQVIHFKLAELRTEIELVRSLCYRACEEYLDGTDVTMLASMAKLKAGRMLRVVTDGCLQYWGGAGYLWESPTARAFRDSRLASIGGGADEVMLQIIAKLMGPLPRLENR